MADLAELLERVKAATGPNFALDWDVHITVRGIEGAGMYGNHPAYTASLDATLALVERCGWRVYQLDASIKGRWSWMLHTDALRDDEYPNFVIDVGNTLPLALLAALLSALIAQPASDDVGSAKLNHED